ncbi:MAG: acyl-CoA reductase [Haliscomenobacter sp.]|nr:acyl-CoA reductase [Haliscomenobacter sp.]
MPLQERLRLLVRLGDYLRERPEPLAAVMEKSQRDNPWFTLENQEGSLSAISDVLLRPEKLEAWLAPYALDEVPAPKTVGLVMAGNLPLVGFHDWLCVFVSGHRAQVKLSDKDPYLLPHLAEVMALFDSRVSGYTDFVSRLRNFDAVIATGSNNSARYFESYFGKYPHIIRKNRNAMGVLTGKESGEEVFLLGKDIFQYFGLGCRNVSKIFVPRDFAFEPFLERLHQDYQHLILHDKFRHNYDYNYALYIINKVDFKMNGCLLLTENHAIASRIAGLHYAYYDRLEEVEAQMNARKEEIQCVVAAPGLLQLETIPFGTTQEPELWDYADGVDTIAFLQHLQERKDP